jgi:peroxiredoxin
MKTNFSHIGLAKLCGWFGITRQAYYQHKKQLEKESLQHDLLIDQVLNIRKKNKSELVAENCCFC